MHRQNGPSTTAGWKYILNERTDKVCRKKELIFTREKTGAGREDT